jgi:tetratricopeptide (TPR) repeat protein
MGAGTMAFPPAVTETTARPAGWRAIAAGLLLVLAVVGVYWNSLGAPFHFDDEPAIVYNPTIRSWAEAWHPPSTGAGATGRPVVNLTFAANYALGGLEPRGYHMVNMLLHALAVLVLWGVVRRTLRWAAPDAAEGMAFAIALLWAVHPLLTESVVCVVQRNEVLGGLFYLLTLYGFIRSQGSGAAGGWQVGSVLACLLGVGSKEIVATAPLLVLLYDRTFVAGTFAAAWRARWGYYLALVATWVPLGWLMAGSEQRAGTVGFGLGMSAWDYLLTQCKALTTYLKLSFWPHPLVVDYGREVSRLEEVWWRGVIILGLLGATVWALVRRPVWGFVGAWFFVILAPSSSFVPLTTQTIAEHRMYLPLAAVVALGVALLSRVTGRWAVPAGVGLALLAGWLTVQRNRDYGSELGLWIQTVERVPGNARAHLNLGQALFKEGHIVEAEARFVEAVRLLPSFAEAHYNLGLARNRLGRSEEAVQSYEEALRLVPDYAVAHNDLGIAHAQAGRVEAARRHFEAALVSRPDFGSAHYNLANLLMQVGDVRDAVPHFAAAVRLAPEVAEMRLSLALALAGSGRLVEAVQEAEEALRRRPDFPAAAHYLGEMRADLVRQETGARR